MATLVTENNEGRLLETLQGLLALSTVHIEEALMQAGTLVQRAMKVDKIDVFIYQRESATMVALGVSESALGGRQKALGLDRQPLANGGTIAEVFRTGVPYENGHVESDALELRGVVQALGIRSQLAVALEVGGERVGVLAAQSVSADFFVAADQSFLQATGSWIGMLIHRVRIVEELAQRAEEQGRRSAADELITFLAHDLNNAIAPLRARHALLELRARKAGRADDVEDVSIAEQTVERLQAMVNDLLDVGQLEAGRFTLRLQVVDLPALAREVARTLGTAVVPVRVLGLVVAVVEADPALLRHVLENVVGNAIKHSPEGAEVQIEIENPSGDSASRYEVTVTDRGAGIPEEMIATLFERYRPGGTHKGLGLWLYLAHQLTKLQGGTLAMDPGFHGGTRFRLSLPRHPVIE